MRMLEKIKNNSAMRILLIAFAFISIIPNLSSAASCTLNLAGEPALQNQICNTWTGMMPIAIIAVMLSFTIAAFIFIIGAAIKNERIRLFGVGELYEAVATAIIIGSFFLIAGLFLQTIPGVFANSLGAAGGVAPTATITDPYVVATNDLTMTVNSLEYEYDCVLNGGAGSQYPIPPTPTGANPCPIIGGYNSGANNFAYISDIVTQQVTLQFPGAPLSGLYLQGAVNFERLYTYMTVQLPEISTAAFLIDGIYVLWGIYYLLIFFSYISPVFIALGIIFRAITPTRALGGMLIALGMGFYVVTPTLIAFLYSPNINPYPSSVSVSGCSGQFAPPTCATFGLISSVLDGLWLQIIFYPILVTAITYTFVTQIGNFIGASSQMGNRLRMGFI